MSPMNDFQRHLLSALYELEQGRTGYQAAANLMQRFGYLSPSQAESIVQSAQSSLLTAARIALAPPGETMTSVTAAGGIEQLEFVVDARVKIATGQVGADGQPIYDYRTIRIQVSGDTTTSELYDQLDALGRSVAGEYGQSGRESEVIVQAIF